MSSDVFCASCQDVNSKVWGVQITYLCAKINGKTFKLGICIRWP